jgi:formylglycine-generating enzyme required for sulfatase activity
LIGTIAVYLPDVDFFGQDSFTYTTTDPDGESDTGVITIDVYDVNDAPIANDDSAITDEDVAVTIGVMANDVEPDGDDFDIVAVTAPANGSAVVVGSSILYTPDPDFNGTDAFSYSLTDVYANVSIPGVVTITVTSVNDAPDVNDGSLTTNEDTAQSIDLGALASDVEGDALTYTAADGANGSVTVVGATAVYLPSENYEGADSFTFTVSDGQDSTTATVDVTVNAVEDSPVASDFNGHIVEDESFELDWTLYVTDPDAGDTLTLSILGQPSNGGTADLGGGSVIYIPSLGFTGTDSFVVTITDAAGNLAAMTATINVIPAPSLDAVSITAGSFEMGDHAGVGDADELPLHTVALDAFDMGRYEVTTQKYVDYLNTSSTAGSISLDGSDVYQVGGAEALLFTMSGTAISHDGIEFSVGAADVSLPASSQTWYGAAHYANWLSNTLGYAACYDETTYSCDFMANGIRLATEAEFEYASRAGEQTPYYQFPWASDIIDFVDANYLGNGINASVGVGSYAANGFGLYDMSGNVAEWCNDWYDAAYYAASSATNPEGPATGTSRVLRGGSWSDDSSMQRSASRSDGSGASLSIGFRLILAN